MNIDPIILLLKGILTYVPVIGDYLIHKKGTGGTESGSYCYTVWLRHLVNAFNSDLNVNPKIVAELGPGDSLGVGLAALLTGADEYYALDILSHSNPEKNLQILDELLTLFKSKSDIPKAFKPQIDSEVFPDHILTADRLNAAMSPERINLIRQAITNPHNSTEQTVRLVYFAPWDKENVIQDSSVDMIFSQAVLEHIDDLEDTYSKLYRWLKPGGYLSNQIDFKSHGTSVVWNGHLGYGDLLWKLFRGRRPFLINRMPYSYHQSLLEDNGFEIVRSLPNKDGEGIRREKLAPRFRDISDEDLIIADAFIQATKKK